MRHRKTLIPFCLILYERDAYCDWMIPFSRYLLVNKIAINSIISCFPSRHLIAALFSIISNAKAYLVVSVFSKKIFYNRSTNSAAFCTKQ